MCYSGCQFENRDGGCNKKPGIKCPADCVTICTAEERDCVWLVEPDLCDKSGECGYQRQEDDK